MFPYTADICPEFLIAFGSHKFVSLRNPDDENIHLTLLPGYEGVITRLRSVNGSYFVSRDDTGVLGDITR